MVHVAPDDRHYADLESSASFRIILILMHHFHTTYTWKCAHNVGGKAASHHK